MTTVMDHARPWLMPSRTLAATIQPQLGATAISSGTGSATAQPAISSRRRPTRCGERAGAEVGERLGEPEGDDERQHRGARGQAEVVAADERQRRALEADHRADEGVDRRPAARTARGSRAARAGRGVARHATSASGASGAVGGDDRGLLLGRRRDVAGQRLDEGVLGVELQRAVVAALEADRRGRVGRQAATADRAGVVGRVEERWSGSASSRSVSERYSVRAIVLDGLLAVGVQVRAAGVADEQRVAGEHEPRLLAARVVGDEVGVVRRARGPAWRSPASSVLPSARPRRRRAGDARTRRRRPQAGTRVAPVRATSSGRPETWSACTCVSNTATIGAPCASASATYSSTRSTCGSTTANCAVRLAAQADTRRRRCRRSAAGGRTRRPPVVELIGLTSYQAIY